MKNLDQFSGWMKLHSFSPGFLVLSSQNRFCGLMNRWMKSESSKTNVVKLLLLVGQFLDPYKMAPLQFPQGWYLGIHPWMVVFIFRFASILGVNVGPSCGLEPKSPMMASGAKCSSSICLYLHIRSTMTVRKHSKCLCMLTFCLGSIGWYENLYSSTVVVNCFGGSSQVS